MDMEYNRTSPFISNCLHYSSEFHPYVGEFYYLYPKTLIRRRGEEKLFSADIETEQEQAGSLHIASGIDGPQQAGFLSKRDVLPDKVPQVALARVGRCLGIHLGDTKIGQLMGDVDPARYEMAVEALERIDRVFESSGRYYMLNVIVDRETSGVVQQACECMYGRFKRLMGINLSSCWPWPGLPSTGDLAGHLSRRAYLCKQAKGALSVLWNGDVAFCALDYNGESIVGNLLEQRYSKVFNGCLARRWRRHLFAGATFPGHFCRGCLVPRYRGIEIKTFRNRYMKMPADERNKIFDRLQKYYDIDLPT